jgi:hypothetical protein
MAPYVMMGNMPFIYPEGTTTTDLQTIYDVMPMWFDDITYNPGHIIMRNTTASKELNMYIDETSGRLEFLGGDTYNYMSGDWMYISVYPEFIQNLNTGTNYFVLSDNFDMDPTLTVGIDITGSTDPDFLYAVLPHNPLDVAIPNGTALLYLEHKITDHAAVDGSITMTLQFPSSIQISQNQIFLYAFNISGTGEWDLAPPEYYLNSVTYDFFNNRMTFEIEVMDPHIIFSAISYEALSGTPEIPGYDLFVIYLMIIVISGIGVKKIRKRR